MSRLLKPNSETLVLAISSRALFNLDESNRIFEEQGIDAYSEHQIANESNLLEPGMAFPLVKKLLKINKEERMVEVVLISRNSADTGLRIFNSIEHYGLDITRATFTSGDSPYPYLSAFKAHLFLSANPLDVKDALRAHCAAATILPGSVNPDTAHEELRIAFDGDAVVFSDESERIFQQEGLAQFAANEKAKADAPLSGGPFKGFLAALHHIQHKLPAPNCPIRTALITARAAPAHERVIKTLRAWNIRIDEATFLGGMDKGAFLKAFGADIFFDDQQQHCDSAKEHVATGHVPHGVSNETN